MNTEREISGRDDEHRWETEGGFVIDPNVRGNVNISRQANEAALWMGASLTLLSAAVTAMAAGGSPSPRHERRSVAGDRCDGELPCP